MFHHYGGCFLHKMGDIVIPTDFVVVNMEANKKLPLIIGTHFLETTGAVIDFPTCKVTLHNVDPRVNYDMIPSPNTMCGAISRKDEGDDPVGKPPQTKKDIVDDGYKDKYKETKARNMEETLTPLPPSWLMKLWIGRMSTRKAPSLSLWVR